MQYGSLNQLRRGLAAVDMRSLLPDDVNPVAVEGMCQGKRLGEGKA